MPCIIKVHGYADGRMFDPPIYIHWHDHSMPPAESVVFCQVPEAAERFADAGVALETWRGVNQVEPVRADGEPNRPMSALTVEIVSVG